MPIRAREGKKFKEEFEQLDEISQRAATGAYAERAARTRDYEDTYQDRDPRGRTKSGRDKSREDLRRIEKKFGKKAGEDAEKAAAQHYGENVDIYAALQDAYNMMYEKKKDSDKCGDDTYWDKEEKKCKSKNKSSGRRSTVIVGHGYPGYGGGGGGGNSDNDGDTDGGDGGGDGGGGGE